MGCFLKANGNPFGPEKGLGLGDGEFSEMEDGGREAGIGLAGTESFVKMVQISILQNYFWKKEDDIDSTTWMKTKI